MNGLYKAHIWAYSSHMETDLYQFVMRELQENKGQWPKIAKGSGVSHRTLSKIARREIKDPGISHIQALHDYFKGKRQAA